MQDKTTELLPIEFQIDLPVFELDLPLLKVEPYKPVVRNFFKIENMFATDRQEFKNPCKENSSKLQPIPSELWLQILSSLKTNALVCVMISCKFFGEITNDQSIRNRLGERVRQKQYTLLVDKQHQFFSNYSDLCHAHPVRPFEVDICSMKENTQLYQPGDKGFVMK